MTADRMIDYLVQGVCIDSAGASTDALPTDEECSRLRLQKSSDTAVYRKHDWPNRLGVANEAPAYQASDSVLERRGSRTLIVQTFDFGTGGREFGRFDSGMGDGGQVLLLIDGWASIAMTEDGGAGVQWFMGPACRSPTNPDGRFASWLAFRSDVGTDIWSSSVAKLNIAAGPWDCPRQFNAAYTRYRLDQIDIPFRVVNVAHELHSFRRRLDVVVSEHYGGKDIQSADHLERFFFAKGFGLVRWERWANAGFAHDVRTAEAARLLARTSRCPQLKRYGAPDANWRLVDCRTWTTLIRQTGWWTVNDYRWAAIEGFGQIQ